MTEPADLEALISAARRLRPRCATASNPELLSDLDRIETLGRLVDGWRVAVAAEVEARSDRRRQENALSWRNDASDGIHLVADVCRISVPEARRRVGLGAALAPRTSITGDLLPSRYPELSDAVNDGTLGIESARVIVRAAQHIRKRVEEARDLAAMVAGLTDIAKDTSTANVEAAAVMWQLRLDPDGPPPDDSGRDRGRSFTLGRIRPDGLTSFSGLADIELAAVMRESLVSRRRGKQLFRTVPGGDDTCEETDPEWREDGVPDPRSKPAQDHDSLAAVLQAGLAAEQDGHASTTLTHEVVVTVTVDQLEARRGQGWSAGAMAGVPMPTVERMTCTGGMRVLVTGLDGEPLYLSRTNRVFTSAQKKALLCASRGVCAAPGCTASVTWLEAHHIDWWHRDEGPTDITNAILLCGYHHALVHARRARVRIHRHRGSLYLLPSDWSGDPQPHQRCRTGPLSGAPPGSRAA